VAGQTTSADGDTFTRCEVTLTHRRPTALPRSRSHNIACGSEALPWLVKVSTSLSFVGNNNNNDDDDNNNNKTSN